MKFRKILHENSENISLMKYSPLRPVSSHLFWGVSVQNVEYFGHCFPFWWLIKNLLLGFLVQNQIFVGAKIVWENRLFEDVINIQETLLDTPHPVWKSIIVVWEQYFFKFSQCFVPSSWQPMTRKPVAILKTLYELKNLTLRCVPNMMWNCVFRKYFFSIFGNFGLRKIKFQ